MSIINDKKLSLIVKLIISYVILLDFVFLFYVFNTDPSSDQTARGSVLTNLLVWSATLFTPIAAYFFYDSWKDQKNYELNKEILLEVDTILYSIYEELGKNSRRVETLKEINNYKVILEKHGENKKFIHAKETNDLDSKCTLFDALNGTNIKSFQYNFCLLAFRLGVVLEKIYNEYNKYAEKTNISSVDLTTTTTYKRDEKELFSNEIKAVLYYIEKGYEFNRTNSDGSTESVTLTFGDLASEFEISYKKFRDEIITNIKL